MCVKIRTKDFTLVPPVLDLHSGHFFPDQLALPDFLLLLIILVSFQLCPEIELKLYQPIPTHLRLEISKLICGSRLDSLSSHIVKNFHCFQNIDRYCQSCLKWFNILPKSFHLLLHRQLATNHTFAFAQKVTTLHFDC